METVRQGQGDGAQQVAHFLEEQRRPRPDEGRLGPMLGQPGNPQQDGHTHQGGDLAQHGGKLAYHYGVRVADEETQREGFR